MGICFIRQISGGTRVSLHASKIDLCKPKEVSDLSRINAEFLSA